mmetsp:Transcript_65487/g.202872  ORF Transcript_65487/g.202872 Transcript_65487/m.202872 type:complete len:265 (+) Transcript_65487:1-795(+)
MHHPFPWTLMRNVRGGAMASRVDGPAPALVELAQGCAASTADLAQRVVILVADALLMLFAVIAIGQDWDNTCGEMLHLYGAFCIVLCIIDMTLELLRCTMESTLSRLQNDFQPGASTAGMGNENLLGGSIAEGLVGQAHMNGGDARELGAGRSASISTGTLGRGVSDIKEWHKRRVNNLHFWSIVFAVMVSIVFSFFSAHDEECSERAPSLYSYIHIFTYAFILRLGVVILWLCCRTVQNYEDAAKFGLAQRQQQETPLRPLSF